MDTKALPNYKDKKNRYYICVFLITAILAIKKHCYICAFMDTFAPIQKAHLYLCIYVHKSFT